MREELPMECGLALEPCRVAYVDDAPLGVEQQAARRAHVLALEPRCRRHVRVHAQQIAELGRAHAAGAREHARRRRMPRRLRAHAFRERLEQRDVRILAAVEEVRPATFARAADPQPSASASRLEQAHVLRLGLARAARRQAVDARREHADDEFSVETARSRVGSVPAERLRQHGAQSVPRPAPRPPILPVRCRA